MPARATPDPRAMPSPRATLSLRTMPSPRWKKLGGDIAQARGRLLMMIIAIAVGVFAVASISTAYTILEREIARNYLATNPAAALLDVEHLDETVLAGVRAQAGITGAEAGGRLTGRVEVRPYEWLPLLLFVVPDFAAARISAVRLEAGRWPSVPGGLVLERTAMSVANTSLDHDIMVQTPNGAQRPLTVTAVVHDPSLAPAWQEQTVYGYVTPATLSLLGEDPSLHVLKLTVRNPGGDRPGLERAVVGVADWLRRSGQSVGEIRIPPYHHPHQGMMTSVVRMLLIFSVLTLVLGAVLTATLTSSLLAPQVRQIGVMKAIGARSGQIMQLYVALITAIGLLAVSIGLPLGIAAGRALAENTARTLNLELAGRSVPGWLYVVQVVVGVGLPLTAALLPIRAATRRPVRETLSDFGAWLPVAGPGRLVSRISRLVGGGIAFSLVLRNSVRRLSRLALTLGLLAMAGAMFMTSLNIKAAWQRNLTEAGAERHFDLEIHFTGAHPEAAVLSTVSAVAGVRRVEPWNAEAISVARPDIFRIVRTYPDGGHGSLQLQGVPRRSAFLSPVVIAGRWLDAVDADGAVINEQALPTFPGLQVGDRIHVVVRGRMADLRVIGIVREHLTQATVYTSSERLAEITAEAGLAGGVRVALERTDERSAADVIAKIEHALDNSGFKVAQSISHAQLGKALGGHLFILIFTLVATSILMAVVGVMGLGSAMTIRVLERTREFAVMRVIGARAGTIRRGVIGEAVLIGVLSAVIALVLSAPLTLFVVWIVGIGSFGPALGTVLSGAAMPLWLAIVVTSAAAASAYPAWKASKLTIREALAYQ
jgi:putative ABC transport system permease protein